MPPGNHWLPISPPAAIQDTASPSVKWPCPQCTFPRCIRPNCTGIHCHYAKHDRVADRWRAEEWPKRFKHPSGRVTPPTADEKAWLVGRCTVCRQPLRCLVQGCRAPYHCHNPLHEFGQLADGHGAALGTLTVGPCTACPRPPRCISRECSAPFHCHDLGHPFENIWSTRAPPLLPRRTGDHDARRPTSGDTKASRPAQVSQGKDKPYLASTAGCTPNDMFPPLITPGPVASSSYQIDDRGADVHAFCDACGDLSFWL